MFEKRSGDVQTEVVLGLIPRDPTTQTSHYLGVEDEWAGIAIRKGSKMIYLKSWY